MFPRASASGTRKFSQLVEGGFDRLETAIVTSRAMPTTMRRQAALEWLSLARRHGPARARTAPASVATVSFRSSPLSRCAPEHFLFKDDRLSGLVDFGAMGVDSVAGDLARLFGGVAGRRRAARRRGARDV